MFCEWAYLVNLDDQTLEVYQGFQDKPHNKGRFAPVEVTLDKVIEGPEDGDDRTYYPIALVKTYPFAGIPSVEDFIKDLEK